MEAIIRPNAENAARLVEQIISGELRRNHSSVLGLATGNTMEAVYRLLVNAHREKDLDFSLGRTFTLDEYIGLPPSNPHSYRYYMNERLFSQVNLDPRNTHLPNGMAQDLEAECLDYE